MAEESIPFGIAEGPGIPPPVDLSQAQLAEGAALVPCGVHADGSLCYHGIADSAQATQDGGRWRQCKDGQQCLVEAAPGTPQLGRDGWELTPTACPACGATDEVLVRRSPPDSGLPEADWEYFCPVCGDRGTGTPKQAS